MMMEGGACAEVKQTKDFTRNKLKPGAKVGHIRGKRKAYSISVQAG